MTHCVFDGIATVLATFLHRGQMIRIFFLYCPPQKSSIASFTKYLQTILQDIDASSESVIILGDTNIDLFDQKVLTSSLRKFKLRQIMHSSTINVQLILTHVWIMFTPAVYQIPIFHAQLLNPTILIINPLLSIYHIINF